MKKIIFSLMTGVLLFGAQNSDIDKKLDLILNKINQMEKKLDMKDAEIKQLKKEIQQQQKEIKEQKINTKKAFATKSCKNLKVISFDYKYHYDVLPYYTITVTLKNVYPYTITYINGNIFFDDKDGTTLLKQFVKRDVNLKPGQKITLHFEHMITAELEKDLKNEKRSNLKVYFSPTELKFANSTPLECF